MSAKPAPSAKSPKSITDLSANPKNPRKPWRDEQQKESFLHSLQSFGDLSGIVYNLTTKQLVGGHKRIEEFKADGAAAKLVVTERLPKPDAAGTVAYGHVAMSNGVRFSYREVRWDQPKESAANLAANKWGAEWDMPAVAEMFMDVPEEWQGFTGFGEEEIASLLGGFDITPGSLPNIQPQATAGMVRTATFSLHVDQHAVVENAIKKAIAAGHGESELSDNANGNAIAAICAAYLAKK